jgi:hypothetical protein
MTYANNVLPEAMMYSYLVTGKMKYKKIAIITFDFFTIYFMKGQLKVISNRGGLKERKGIFMENSLLKWPLQSLLWICSMMSLRTESIKSNLS